MDKRACHCKATGCKSGRCGCRRAFLGCSEKCACMVWGTCFNPFTASSRAKRRRHSMPAEDRSPLYRTPDRHSPKRLHTSTALRSIPKTVSIRFNSRTVGFYVGLDEEYTLQDLLMEACRTFGVSPITHQLSDSCGFVLPLSQNAVEQLRTLLVVGVAQPVLYLRNVSEFQDVSEFHNVHDTEALEEEQLYSAGSGRKEHEQATTSGPISSIPFLLESHHGKQTVVASPYDNPFPSDQRIPSSPDEDVEHGTGDANVTPLCSSCSARSNGGHEGIHHIIQMPNTSEEIRIYSSEEMVVEEHDWFGSSLDRWEDVGNCTDQHCTGSILCLSERLLGHFKVLKASKFLSETPANGVAMTDASNNVWSCSLFHERGNKDGRLEWNQWTDEFSAAVKSILYQKMVVLLDDGSVWVKEGPSCKAVLLELPGVAGRIVHMTGSRFQLLLIDDKGQAFRCDPHKPLEMRLQRELLPDLGGSYFSQHRIVDAAVAQGPAAITILTGSGNVYCGDSIVDGDFDSPPVRALGSGLILTAYGSLYASGENKGYRHGFYGVDMITPARVIRGIKDARKVVETLFSTLILDVHHCLYVMGSLALPFLPPFIRTMEYSEAPILCLKNVADFAVLDDQVLLVARGTPKEVFAIEL